MLNNHPINPDSLLLFTKHQQSIDIWRVPTLASLRPWGVSNFGTGTSGNLRMLGATWSNMSSVQNPMDVNSPLKSNEPDYINIYIYIYYKYIYIINIYISYIFIIYNSSTRLNEGSLLKWQVSDELSWRVLAHHPVALCIPGGSRRREFNQEGTRCVASWIPTSGVQTWSSC